MKLKKLSLIAASCLLLSTSLAHAATTLMEIGRHPFHCRELTSPDELVTMLRDRKADVRKGFNMTPQAQLYDAFMAQLPEARINTTQFRKGSHFEWMIFQRNGTGPIQVVKDVTWGNDKPFTAFQFHIDHQGQRYTFVMPRGCGNLALSDVSPTPTAPAVTKPPAPRANQAPECRMTVSPTKAFQGEVITVDARNSVDRDGNISKMAITFVNNQGQVVSEKVIGGNQLVGKVAMPRGNNTLRVTVTDNQGAEATSPACMTNVTGINRLRPVLDLGYLHQFDPGNYVLGRIGLEYRITEQFSMLGLVGMAPHTEGMDGDDAYLFDILGEYNFARFFINLGAGGWFSEGDDDLDAEDTQLDVIVGMGARIYGAPEEFNVSLFVEGRAAPDEFDDLSEYARVGGGLRCRF